MNPVIARKGMSLPGVVRTGEIPGHVVIALITYRPNAALAVR